MSGAVLAAVEMEDPVEEPVEVVPGETQQAAISALRILCSQLVQRLLLMLCSQPMSQPAAAARGAAAIDASTRVRASQPADSEFALESCRQLCRPLAEHVRDLAGAAAAQLHSDLFALGSQTAPRGDDLLQSSVV